MFGFIGVGNMGGAVAAAVCKSVGADKVLLCNRTAAKAETLAQAMGCRVADNQTAAATCRYLFLGIKPQNMGDLLAEGVGRMIRALGKEKFGDTLVSDAKVPFPNSSGWHTKTLWAGKCCFLAFI